MNPEYTLMSNLYIVYSDLMDKLDDLLSNKDIDFDTVINLLFEIDSVVHIILESKGVFNDSTRSISRRKRRYDRNKIRETGTEVRKTSKRSIRENICHEQDDQRACVTARGL